MLKTVDAHGTEIEFRCIDEYTFTIPVSDADKYGVILARTMNGKVLDNDNYGPLWVMYPRDQYPDELKTPLGEATLKQYQRMIDKGLGELDKSGVAELTFKDRAK